jgi:hypothetical protein
MNLCCMLAPFRIDRLFHDVGISFLKRCSPPDADYEKS